jgi:hypothetical protein
MKAGLIGFAAAAKKVGAEETLMKNFTGKGERIN